MFNFIKSTDISLNETSTVLDKYEQTWHILFPEHLRTWYMYYNFSEFKKNKKGWLLAGNHKVSMILPLRNNDTWSVEEYRELISSGKCSFDVSESFIPFAVHEDFCCYFWNKDNGKVYVHYGMSSIGTTATLQFVSESVEEFFASLDHSAAQFESGEPKKKRSWFMRK